MSKKKRPRTEKRARAREQQKLGDAREKLARLSPGGTPERAIDVKTAAVVERVSLALGCARCDGELRLEAHDALDTDHGPLRRVRGQCKRCRAIREVWLRVIALN